MTNFKGALCFSLKYLKIKLKAKLPAQTQSANTTTSCTVN